jgi:pimeloyl-ACP methyl ester carboxylesterase
VERFDLVLASTAPTTSPAAGTLPTTSTVGSNTLISVRAAREGLCLAGELAQELGSLPAKQQVDAFGQRFRCVALDLPWHGQSAPAPDHSAYSLPGHAAVLAAFTEAAGTADAVIVGWSLGGHVALEAAPSMLAAAGYVVFGAPRVSPAAPTGHAFLPNPVINVGFTAAVGPEQARAFAASFTAPGSALSLDEFTADILRTDGAARAGLFASLRGGRFADEVAIVAALQRPLVILHGQDEQLVNLGYLQELTISGLWRGGVQLVAGAGHAPHQETPGKFTELLTQFITDLG